MRLADGIIEIVATLLFAYVAISVASSLYRSGNFSVLAVAFISVFAFSAPHRLIHAHRLLTGIGPTDPVGLMIDAVMLVSLGVYVMARFRLHPLAGEKFTLIADQVGLERWRTEVAECQRQALQAQAEARQLRSDLDLERARVATFAVQIQGIVPLAADLAAHAAEVAAGEPPDRERLQRVAGELYGPLAELSKTLGLP
jgi:hypothetical protein